MTATRESSGADAVDALVFVLAIEATSAPSGFAYQAHVIGETPCAVAYSDLATLSDCCGPHQPWVALPLSSLVDDLSSNGLGGPVVNVPLAVDARWTASGPPVHMDLTIPNGDV